MSAPYPTSDRGGRRYEQDYDDEFYPPPRRGGGRAQTQLVEEEVVETTRHRSTRARSRSRSTDRGGGNVPAWMLADAPGRRVERDGQLVVREREIVEADDHHLRGPEQPLRSAMRRPGRPGLGPPEQSYVRISEEERVRIEERDRNRAYPRQRLRSPSPSIATTTTTDTTSTDEDIHISTERYRGRGRSRERVQRRHSHSSSISPDEDEPAVIRGPTYEREVITHYRDIDHGVSRARAPSPPVPVPILRRTQAAAAYMDQREREELDIDVHTSRRGTEVDIHRERSISRSRSRHRPAPVPVVVVPPENRRRRDQRYDHEDEEIDVHVHRHSRSRSRVGGGAVEVRRGRSRTRSAHRRDTEVDEESAYITGRIDARGEHGEARHGATRDWTIVDVPPGTQRVRMDGAGGGAAEVTWNRYAGVRRSRFLPDGDNAGALVAASTAATAGTELVVQQHRRRASSTAAIGARGREIMAPARASGDRLKVEVHDRHRTSGGGEHEHDLTVGVETSNAVALRPVGGTPGANGGVMRRKEEVWTEITKDLVEREALERLRYTFEDSEFFFYVMEYLSYEDILELTQLSERIRRARLAARQPRERRYLEYSDDREVIDVHTHHRSRSRRPPQPQPQPVLIPVYDDRRVREREVVVERQRRW